VLCVVRDVTQLRAIEAQLAQAQKMEAIGQLTGGMAHDFNNLLAVIQGNLELIESSTGGDRELSSMLSDALRATRRGAALTHQMLAYSRKQSLAPRVVEIDPLIGSVTTMLRRTLGETIEVRKEIASNLWSCQIDPHQLENALLNLAVNARDAMTGGGRLTFSAENCLVDETYAEQNLGLLPGAYVLLQVTDTGSGMSRDVLEHVLEPFFTTKPVGQGTGLGLSMVYGFVKQSGGHLKIYSEEGKGTSVKLYLPKARDETERHLPAANDRSESVKGGNETILVIEDDDMVRKLIVRTLSEYGYRTVQAANGPDALKFLRDGGRVDMMLTDVVLPKGMTGPAIAREARALSPGLRVLFMSGFASDTLDDTDGMSAQQHLLLKPFSNVQLARKLRELLDGE
jgi:nitrogen-specific signal transduction histidine kinase